MKDAYVQAPLGIIQGRRHDLAGLQELTFAPSAMASIQESLTAAIAEAMRDK